MYSVDVDMMLWSLYLFCVHRLKKKQRVKLKKEQQAPSADSKQEADSTESGRDSDDAYENPFVIGGR